MAEVARCTAHRQTRNRRSLASGRLSTPLGAKVQEERPARIGSEDQALDQAYESGEPALARAEDPLGIKEVLTAPASPWQNAYAERVIGTIRRESLDHMIILGEQHLRRTVKSYSDYYNRVRTHLSLDKDSPKERVVQLPYRGAIQSRRHCGGLHHEYYRGAA